MIVEIGHFSLILATFLAIAQLVISFITLRSPNLIATSSAKSSEEFYTFNLIRQIPLVVCLLTTISLVLLIISFIQNDFSSLYVASHSSRELPLIFRITATWGAHEGSLLLWLWMLTAWGAVAAFINGNLPQRLVIRILVVLSFLIISFNLFIIYTSSPFLRLFPIPENGRDLNPLLQDIGLAIHPPTLYMGYVGTTIPFAAVVAFFIGKELNAKIFMDLIKWLRPWIIVTSLFLSIGIVLGSWWAYYELGWGGWWFWDPVENVSLLPWLVSIALLHMLYVNKRNILHNWVIILSLAGFSLSLIGTFIVRSGILTSVHAFATDPARGTAILLFLLLTIGTSMVIYVIKVPSLIKSLNTDNSLSFPTRESLLFLMNVLFTAAMFVVLFGTLYPLILETLGLGQISVGRPYFHQSFIPIAAPTALLLGLSLNAKWGSQNWRSFLENAKIRNSFWITVIMTVIGIVIFYPHGFEKVLFISIAIALGGWVISTSLISIYSEKKSARAIGKTLAHIGFGMFIIAATLSTQLAIEKDVLIQKGDEFDIVDDYRIVLGDVMQIEASNYISVIAEIELYKSDELIDVLHPEKRSYILFAMPTSESAIYSTIGSDILIAIGALQDDSISLRIIYKPFLLFLWISGILVSVGLLLAIVDRKKKSTKYNGTPESVNDNKASL